MLSLVIIVVVLDRLLVFCEVSSHLVKIFDHFTLLESFRSGDLSFLVYFAITLFPLCQVASQIDSNGCGAKHIITLFCGDVVLDRMLKSLPLTLYTHFHLAAQLLVDLEVLEL